MIKQIRTDLLKYLSNDLVDSDHDSDGKFRRTIILNSVLLLTIISLVLFKFVELIFFGEIQNIELVTLIIITLGGVHAYFRLTNKLEATSYLATGFLIFAFISVQLSGYELSAPFLYWSILIPVFAFSQFDNKKAIILIVLFYLYIAGYFYYHSEILHHEDFGIKGMMNYFGAVLLCSMLTINLENRRLDLIKMLRLKNKELETISTIDKLTGIYNRSKLDNMISIEIKRTTRQWQPLTVLMLDIDHFKFVNDTYGHLAGDDILKQIAETIMSTCRTTDIVGRWGGEEFIVICPITTIEGATILAQKIGDNVRNGNYRHGLRVTVSIGITQYTETDTPDSLLMKSDKAMYKAKESGRDRIEVYNE